MKTAIEAIRTTLDHLLVAFVLQVIIGLSVALVGDVEADVLAVCILAALLALELLAAIALANRAAGLAETASRDHSPVERVQVLRARSRYGGGQSPIAPLNGAEIEELRVLEAGLKHRRENRRVSAVDRG